MKKRLTAERLETHIYNVTTIEHLHRYSIATKFVNDKIVLDIASGEGYGSNLLSKLSKKVYGVDISKETIQHARNKYKNQNLEFMVGSTSAIPIPNNSIDVVVSFETIEHHDQHEEMMNEIKRVIKKDGILIVSSPDKKYYSDIPKHINPYHVKELYRNQFEDLIKKHFDHSMFFQQKIVYGSLIIREDFDDEIITFKGTFDEIENSESFHGTYNLCIASNKSLQNFPSSIFDGSKIISQQIEDAKEFVMHSWRYRIGDFLLYPIKLLKKINE